MTDPLDFLAVDGLLDADERDIRDTVRAFADAELAPYVADWYEQGTLPDDLGPRLGKLGLLGMHLEGYGCAGTQRRGVRRGVPRARGGGLGAAQLRVRAGLAGDVRDPPLGDRGAQGRVAAADGDRRGARLLRAHRAGRRQRPGVDAHPRGPRRRRLGAQRLQDVDHQRHPGRRRRGVGADRRRDPRLRGADLDARVHGHQDPAQAVAAGVGHRRAVLRRPAAARRRGVPRGARSQGAAELPERGALRDPLGGRRGGPGLLRRGAGVLPAAQPVRQAARGVPAHPEEARRDGHRGQQRLPRRGADRPAQGRGRAVTGAGRATASSPTCGPRSTWRGPPGPCSAAPGSPWTTRSCGT